MSCYDRGEKVWWYSPVTGDRSQAIFVKHDKKGFPKKDCILAIRLGPRGSKKAHTFRWPLKLVSHLDQDAPSLIHTD